MKSTKQRKSAAKKAPVRVKTPVFSEEIRKGDVIAVGDIHGSWDLFCQFLAWVKDSEASVILLGDLIDRGDDDLAVLNAVKGMLEDPESWGLQSFNALRGNHEQMIMDAANYGRASFRLWVSNGGKKENLDLMVEEHLDWISNLPIFMSVGETLFIHGGTFPGENPVDTMRNGKAEELLWMRKPFLTQGPKLESWTKTIRKVVHGHTITLFEEGQTELAPVIREDRVNIDTAAYNKDGYLTAYNVTQNTFNQFQRYPFDEEDSHSAFA